MKKAILSILLVSFGAFAFAQSTTEISLAGLDAIQENDLRKDLYEFADASFKGRAAGTIDELNAAVWVAERYRTIGLQPAGDNNSYFQFFNMWRNRIAETSTVSINDRTLTLERGSNCPNGTYKYRSANCVFKAKRLKLI